MVKVTINSVSKNRVSINTRSQNKIRTVGIGAATSISTLNDVDVTNLIDGETLVWNADQQKFIAEMLPKVDLDGGQF